MTVRVTASTAEPKVNRVTTVVDRKGITSFGYEARDQRTSISYPNGVTRSRATTPPSGC